MKQQERIIELQRQVKISKDALQRISSGCRNPESVAGDALYAMWPLEQKQGLQVLVGHEKRKP